VIQNASKSLEIFEGLGTYVLLKDCCAIYAPWHFGLHWAIQGDDWPVWYGWSVAVVMQVLFPVAHFINPKILDIAESDLP